MFLHLINENIKFSRELHGMKNNLHSFYIFNRSPLYSIQPAKYQKHQIVLLFKFQFTCYFFHKN